MFEKLQLRLVLITLNPLSYVYTNQRPGKWFVNFRKSPALITETFVFGKICAFNASGDENERMLIVEFDCDY